MANNRMWLVHRPTGRCVLLAKRMTEGWYLGSRGESLQDDLLGLFSDAAESGEGHDDFLLVYEEGGERPFALSLGPAVKLPADWLDQDQSRKRLDVHDSVPYNGD